MMCRTAVMTRPSGAFTILSAESNAGPSRAFLVGVIGLLPRLGNHLFQSSLRSRCTAALAGFAALDPDRTSRHGRRGQARAWQCVRFNTCQPWYCAVPSASAALRARNGDRAVPRHYARSDEGVEDCSAGGLFANPVAPAHQHGRNRDGRRLLAKCWAAFDHDPIPPSAVPQSPRQPRTR